MDVVDGEDVTSCLLWLLQRVDGPDAQRWSVKAPPPVAMTMRRKE